MDVNFHINISPWLREVSHNCDIYAAMTCTLICTNTNAAQMSKAVGEERTLCRVNWQRRGVRV